MHAISIGSSAEASIETAFHQRRISLNIAEIESRIEGFVRSQFNVSDEDPRFGRTSHLFEEGYVDSVGVVELLAFIQEEFAVEIPEEELTSDSFSDIYGIARVLSRLSDGSPTPPGVSS
jgi:acyl carrier protein